MAKLRDVIASNLQRLLPQKDISQTDLAEMAKTTFQTVNGYFNGRVSPSEKMLSKFAGILGVEETELTSDRSISSHTLADCLNAIAKAVGEPKGSKPVRIEEGIKAQRGTIDTQSLKTFPTQTDLMKDLSGLSEKQIETVKAFIETLKDDAATRERRGKSAKKESG
jgi:transcriptional regulator with XRE-family HTH domain